MSMTPVCVVESSKGRVGLVYAMDNVKPLLSLSHLSNDLLDAQYTDQMIERHVRYSKKLRGVV